MTRRGRGIAAAVLLTVTAIASAYADEADVFFDDRVVHEVRLYFTDPNWYEVLYESHANDPNDPYFPARFEYGSIVLDPVGVRFKGSSSFNIPTVKKSFKLNFNKYYQATFVGLKKLNLNNSYNDPTMLREKLFLDFAGKYGPTIRAVHARLYVNDQYWGLYTAVEQVDSTFARSRFGEAEAGNLFKAETNEPGHPTNDFGSDLTWLGPDPEPYHKFYQLQTNEATNDYSQLIAFIDVLNNTPPAQFPAVLEPIFDVPGALRGLALNNLFVNIDSYNGAAHNYFLYDRDDTGRITHIHWDTNESFGRFLMFMDPWDDPLEMDPFWLPAPYQGQVQRRPLMENLWAVDAYQRAYLRFLARMLREGFDTPTVYARIVQLANLIRADVYADPNKQYTSAQFETNLTTNIGSGPSVIYGLRHFVNVRANWLNQRLNDFAEPRDIQLNELMSVNVTTLPDEANEYDPWLEIHNLGPGAVDLSGLYLTDDNGQPTKWALPAGVLDDGQFRILWLDGQPAQGANHATFMLNPAGGMLYLFAVSGSVHTLLDSVFYPALGADVSFGRHPDGEGPWSEMHSPTPGAANQPDAPLEIYINEFMADNDSTIEDPEEPGAYEDWIEIYNAGPEAVDLGGMYLTDNLANLTKWPIPAGVSIAPGQYLLFWADEEPEQGPTHANFKLSAGGEEIGLVARNGSTRLDSLDFGPQYTDVSYGRYPDGTGPWNFMGVPTPGAANQPHNAPPVIANTTHTPAAPGPQDTVWVTCRATDDVGVAAVKLSYDAGGGWLDVTMYDDGLHHDGAAGDDVYGGAVPPQPENTVVHYYVTATDDLGAKATDPKNAPMGTYSYVVGYAPPSLYINEFMADNDTTIRDEGGDYDDWFELYNAGPAAVDLGGMYLTDSLSNPTKWRIPAGVVIEAGGHRLFWADEEENEGPTHTNFKLSKSGEALGLYDRDAHGNAALDTVVFGYQTTDISMGRFPDGGACRRFFRTATPGTANADPYAPYDSEPDGDVDWADYGQFAAGLKGPAGGVATGYEVFDGDCDGDVDLADFAGLQAAFGAP